MLNLNYLKLLITLLKLGLMVLMLCLSALMIIPLIFAFEGPGSENNPFLWAVAFLVVTLPIAIAVAIWKPKFWYFPVFLVVVATAGYLGLGILCQGRFGRGHCTWKMHRENEFNTILSPLPSAKAALKETRMEPGGSMSLKSTLTKRN